MLAEKSRRQFELDELLDINKSEEVIATDETELESGDKDSKDNEMVDENNNSKRKSMSEVVNSVGKYKTENIKVVQELNSSMERSIYFSGYNIHYRILEINNKK